MLSKQRKSIILKPFRKNAKIKKDKNGEPYWWWFRKKFDKYGSEYDNDSNDETESDDEKDNDEPNK